MMLFLFSFLLPPFFSVLCREAIALFFQILYNELCNEKEVRFKVYSISPFKELSTDTRERYEWSFPFMKQELTKPSSLRAISMLAVFTFSFLSTEYFYVNRIAQNASSARTVNIQNYALGISAVGFCLYPLLFRFFSRSSAQRCVFSHSQCWQSSAL